MPRTDVRFLSLPTTELCGPTKKGKTKRNRERKIIKGKKKISGASQNSAKGLQSERTPIR